MPPNSFDLFLAIRYHFVGDEKEGKNAPLGAAWATC